MDSEQLKKLQNLKKESGITNKQIAAAVGTTESTVSRIFSGEVKDPGFTLLTQIIVILGGSPDEIVGLETGGEEMNAINAIRQIYDNQISGLNKDKKALFFLTVILLIFVLGLFAFDVINGSVGWLRY